MADQPLHTAPSCPSCGEPIIEHDSDQRKRCHDACSGYQHPQQTAPSFELHEDDGPTLDCASFHRHTSLCYGIDNWQGEL